VGSIVNGYETSDVLQGGQITLRQQFETYTGSNIPAAASDVTIGITAATDPATGQPVPGAGQGTPLAPTSTGVAPLSEALYQYVFTCPADTATGDYLVTWAATVAGQAAKYVQAVTVAAMATGAPAPGVYASIAQYRAWSRDQFTPDDLVAMYLQRATEDLDIALVAAVYPTNDNGMPTDAMVIDCFARATCAQVQFLIADNDPAGIKRQYSSTSMGGVSQTRVAAMTAMPMPPLAPRAAAILHTAGVLPSAVLVSW
jgi:hypothetical protein